MNPYKNPESRTSAPSAANVPVVRRAMRRRSEGGAIAVEYALLLVGLCVPVMIALAAAGVAFITTYGTLRNAIVHVGP
jgi:Flp pilus assembly pilin Flp